MGNEDTDDWVVNADTKDTRRIGSNIRFMRQEKGLSQQDLAREMKQRGQSHWHQTTVSRVERGVQEVSMGELAALEQVLGSGLLFGTRTDVGLQAVGVQVERTLALRRLRYVHEALIESEKVVRELRALYRDPQLEAQQDADEDPVAAFEEGFDVSVDRDHVEVVDDRTSKKSRSTRSGK